MEKDMPLGGIRIVEMSLMVAGASCTRMMADWGADVIKVENTKSGDNFRLWPAAIGAPNKDDCNPVFDNLNANKRSISVDTGTAEGREIVYRLLEHADAFVTNFRTGALKKQGLDYDTLKEKFPKLVMTQINGYGDKGAEAGNPGYDNTSFWARGGFLYSQSTYDSPEAYPVYMPMGFGDVACAMGMMAGTVSAIYAARKYGRGDHVTLSLYGTAAWLANVLITCSQYDLHLPVSRKYANPFGLVCKCKDGRWFLPQCVIFAKDAMKYFKVLGFDDMLDNPKYATRDKFNDPEVIDWIDRRIEAAFATKTAEEWKRIFDENDLCCEILSGYGDVLSDEQAIANDYIYKMRYENGHESWLVRPSLHSENAGLPEYRPGPKLGENTVEILTEFGFTEDVVKDWLSGGIVKQHD